jgi:hypothetical protein
VSWSESEAVERESSVDPVDGVVASAAPEDWGSPGRSSSRTASAARDSSAACATSPDSCVCCASGAGATCSLPRSEVVDPERSGESIGVPLSVLDRPVPE